MSVVDAHSHLFPRRFVELLRGRTVAPRVVGAMSEERLFIFPADERSGGRPLARSAWDPEEKLVAMDRWGIDRAVVQMANPLLEPFDGTEAEDAAAELNAAMAELAGVTSGRLAGLGVLPQHSVEAAATWIEAIAREDGLHGVANGPTLCRRQLDDADLDPLWGALERLDVPLTIHPQRGPSDPMLDGPGLAGPLGLGMPFETTAALTRLVLGGVFRRFPGLRNERTEVPPSRDLSRIWVDAVVFGPLALRAATSLVGPDRVLFGTDHPYAIADPERSLAAIAEVFGDGDEGSAVTGGTAERFFGLS
jgi:predicted TIM-barrel fold metal-dependent hydrolase